jgi:hypothetical protein
MITMPAGRWSAAVTGHVISGLQPGRGYSTA